MSNNKPAHTKSNLAINYGIREKTPLKAEKVTISQLNPPCPIGTNHELKL